MQTDDQALRLRAATRLRLRLRLEAKDVKLDAAFTDSDLGRQIRGRGYEKTEHGMRIPTEVYARFLRLANGRHSLGD